MNTSIKINTDRLLADLKHLATFGKSGNGVNRRSLTEEDMTSRSWLVERMREAGMQATIDGAGSVIGKTTHARRILIGSHSDTVPKGGWLDGAMGVIYGLEIARAVIEAKDDLEIGIEVISFIDEEGRFTPLMGSQIFCAEIPNNDFHNYATKDGLSFEKARNLAGLHDEPVQHLDPARHLAYLEAHIEQGPVLEAANTTIGAVTGIVGASQFKVRFHGQSNHAGTTPMSLRQDAAKAMFEFVQGFTAFCQDNAGSNTVWTFSEVRTEPMASNVIPNLAECSIQFRDTSTDILSILDNGVAQTCQSAASENKLEFSLEKTVTLTPTIMDEKIVRQIELAANDLGANVLRMPSGAGHDAMVLGRYIPAGMLFIPSIGGLSHDSDEDTAEEDIRKGAEVFALGISKLIDELQSKD